MISNFYFARAGDYFGTNSESWPLLHTWSLSVEEQFYLFFPFLLCLVHGRWRRRIMLTAAFASFGLSVIAVHTHPQDAFYLLPTRAWQLLTGALLVETCPNPLKTRVSKFVTLAGLLAILFPMVVLDSSTAFPGWAALPSTLGAACLLIGMRDHKGIVRRTLAAKWPVRCGMISYSLISVALATLGLRALLLSVRPPNYCSTGGPFHRSPTCSYGLLPHRKTLSLARSDAASWSDSLCDYRNCGCFDWPILDHNE